MLTLQSTPDNPVPSGGSLVAVRTHDGVQLRAAVWRSTTRHAKGTVCLLQGRAEFVEKYYETVSDLRRRGFCVVAFDWRGQGESGRQLRDPRMGHVASFREYRIDLRAIAEAVLVPTMPEPYYGLAHSMGGTVALTGALQGWLPFARLVTIAPMLSIRMVRHPRLVMAIATTLDRLGFGRRMTGRPISIATLPFRNNRLSTDAARYARNAAAAASVGPGAVGDPTLGWVASAYRAMRVLRDPRAPPRIAMPILVVAAGADTVCGTVTTERFATRLRAGHFLVLPGARHEILTECDAIRTDFWAAFDAFIPGTGAAEERPAAAAAR